MKKEYWIIQVIICLAAAAIMIFFGTEVPRFAAAMGYITAALTGLVVVRYKYENGE